MKRLLPRGIIVSLVLATACRREDLAARDAAEQQVPILRDAYARLDAGDREGAIAKLQTVLDANPLLARPHLDLALLLHDHGGDYVRAIYHYRRYLDLRSHTEKRDLIDARIRLASEAYARQAGARAPAAQGAEADNGPQADDQSPAMRIAELEATAAGLRSEIARLTAAHAAAVEQVNAVTAERDKVTAALLRTRRVAVSDSPDSADSQTPATHVEAVAYTVQDGDTLARLARRFYGDATLWPRLWDANRDTLQGSVTLHAGQELRIPGKNQGGEP